jgi:hypothetical protein
MIEEFGPKMIERFVRDAGYKFMTDQSGNYVLDFYGDNVPDYRVHLSVDGQDRSILFIQISPRITYPEGERDRLEALMSGWNRRTRWPKAYLLDDSRGRGIRVIAENAYPLVTGVQQQLVDALILANVHGASNLLREVSAGMGTSTVDELEAWLRRTG